jgi:hypothetical protein
VTDEIIASAGGVLRLLALLDVVLRLLTTISEVENMARDPIHPGRFLADELEALEMREPLNKSMF